MKEVIWETKKVSQRDRSWTCTNLRSSMKITFNVYHKVCLHPAFSWQRLHPWLHLWATAFKKIIPFKLLLSFWIANTVSVGFNVAVLGHFDKFVSRHVFFRTCLHDSLMNKFLTNFFLFKTGIPVFKNKTGCWPRI